MAGAFPAMMPRRRENIAAVMLQYLNNSSAVVNRPGGAQALILKRMLTCVSLAHEPQLV